MSTTMRRTDAASQATLQPLDNAEQDQVLRQRLTHPLSHRPLQIVRHRLSAVLQDLPATAIDEQSSEASQQQQQDKLPLLQSASLLSELQSYLLALNRLNFSTTHTAAAQIAEYERQYIDIKRQEAESAERIKGLKLQLEEVRRRRKEKIEYGRVVESVEKWFKSGGAPGQGSQGTGEIEESLSNLMAQLTSSFLYDPSPSPSSSTQCRSLMLLHSKLDDMLNLSRQVRELVGWKPGSGLRGGPAAESSSTTATAAASGPASATAMDRGQGSSTGSLDPNARPFEPAASTAGSSKRARPQSGRSALLSSAALGEGGDLEEGEEPGTPSSMTSVGSSKKRRLASALGGPSEEGEADEEEEGSIPVQKNAGGASQSRAKTSTGPAATAARSKGSTTAPSGLPARPGLNVRGGRGRSRAGGRG